MAPKEFKVVAIDLDGTLLDEDKKMSEANRDAIRTLHNEGVRIVLASGRPTHRIEVYEEQLGFDCDIVSYNGACAYSASSSGDESKSKSRLFHAGLDTSVSDLVLEWVDEQRIPTTLYHDDQAFGVESYGPSLFKWYSTASGYSPNYNISSYREEFAGRHLTKLLLMDEPHLVPELHQRVHKLLEGKDAHIVLDHTHVEVLHADVNKGAGVKGLMEQLQIPLSDVVAFGDGNNDVEMLQLVGYGVAMRNGTPLAKSAAKRVTAYTNEEDGLAREIMALRDEGFFGGKN